MEKYGQIPKRFTAAWWDYIWYYYKWHILGTLFALSLIGITAVQCANKIDYDIVVTYIGEAYCGEEARSALEADMAAKVGDINQNEKEEVFFQPIILSAAGQQPTDPQYEMAMQTKMNLELQAGEAMLYCFSPERANALMATDAFDGYFVPVSEWAKAPLRPEQEVEGRANGYMACIKENTYFEPLGFVSGDIYLAVRVLRADEQKEKKIDFYNQRMNASIELANQLLQIQ